VYWGKKQLLEIQHEMFSENKVLYGWPVLQSERLIGFSTVLHVTKIKRNTSYIPSAIRVKEPRIPANSADCISFHSVRMTYFRMILS
jgi:hypothetical protein